MKTTNLFAILLVALVASSSAEAVTIDLVPVGNAGNAPDIRYNNISFGSVDHAYQIGKYEVTAGQYSAFLNAVAKGDPNGLYNPAMGAPFNNYGINIQRAGSSPNYSYSVPADWANRPVAFVSFWDATRYANWLHNDQPTGVQGPGTTEGGAYHDVGNQVLFGRNPGAKFFIPTENEWYKAAYHDQTAGLAASYFDYPMGSNTTPINTLPDSVNHANFYDNFGTGNHSYTIAAPYYRTNVGEFVNSASPYGTFDQGGNVREWNETAVATSTRGFRGGTWGLNSFVLHASAREDFTPTLEQEDLGFRIASAAIPEPSTGVLGAIACGLMWWRRSARATLRLSSKNRSPVFSLFRCLDVGRPLRFFAIASLAIVTYSCAISAAYAGTFQITGRVRQVNSFTVDIAGLMQVNNPFQLIYSFDPTLSDSNANSTFGVYEQSVGGPYFLNGSAGNFAFSATDTFKMVVQNQDAIFPDNYSVQIAVSNVGFSGNFPAGTAPNNTEMYMPIAFDIPNAQGDANLLTPPNLASIPTNNKNFQFYFKDASNTTVAQFFAFVDEAHIIPEPATFTSAGLALIALVAFASHGRGRVPISK